MYKPIPELDGLVVNVFEKDSKRVVGAGVIVGRGEGSLHYVKVDFCLKPLPFDELQLSPINQELMEEIYVLGL